jgi:hypothetical protein
VLKEPRQHARERERDFDDVSKAALGGKKTSKKPKKESNDEKVTTTPNQREREKRDTHTHTHTHESSYTRI